MAITGTLALFHSWEILETRAFVSYSPPGLGFRRGFSFWCPSLSRRSPETRRWITGAQSLPRLVEEFDPKVPIEEAVTPPSSWYTEPSFLALELDRVFSRGWLAAGSLSHFLFSPYLFLCRHWSKMAFFFKVSYETLPCLNWRHKKDIWTCSFYTVRCIVVLDFKNYFFMLMIHDALWFADIQVSLSKSRTLMIFLLEGDSVFPCVFWVQCSTLNVYSRCMLHAQEGKPNIKR